MVGVANVKTVYLVGGPGSGKTTIMRTILAKMPETGRYDKPVKHSVHVYNETITVSLGWERAPFGGTDTLGFSAIIPIENVLLPTLAAAQISTLFGEGDRLANDRFFRAAQRYGDLLLFYVDVDAELSAQRRADRAAKNNLPIQSESWTAGRFTKVQRLVDRWNVTRLDGAQSPSILADQIMSISNDS